MDPPSTSTLTLQLPAGPVCLLADRAAFLPEAGMLLVADAHLGKAQTFRSLGVPVPGGTTVANLQRLSHLIAATKARELVFLGDLLHARQAQVASLHRTFEAWRQTHAGLRMRLVRGNHDSQAGDPPRDWKVEPTAEPLRVGAWALCHHPQTLVGAYALAGHLHPGFVVGTGRQRLRLPCFHFSSALGVLPAFGEFTGLHTVTAAPGDRVVLVADQELRLLPG